MVARMPAMLRASLRDNIVTTEHVDVIVAGAGISGISAAWHLQKNCPSRSYVVLEGRAGLGGTWDLFRYPGIRSDSDMYTLGFAFRPWTEAKSIADGPSIMRYLRDTVRESGIDRHIRYNQRITAASWSTEKACWTVDVQQPGGDVRQMTCNFLFMCTGYYRYDEGYTPAFAGQGDFAGKIVHPQKWTSDIDYTGKQVVVIGSGATAVTLVPELAKKAAHVTMLQRSPSYVISLPAKDKFANWLRRVLPSHPAYSITRWYKVLTSMYFYNMCRRWPAQAKKYIFGEMRKQLGPDYDIATHFSPSYNPWEQRLCMVPDNDLFVSLKAGTSSIVTDHVDRFTPTGIVLKSGKALDADIIVTATGLKLQIFAGIPISVDGTLIELANCVGYKGMMISGVPNLAMTFGYTNASWTLKADLTSSYVCRLLNHMQAAGLRQCTPRFDDPAIGRAPWVDLSSGYFQRVLSQFPSQGTKTPWKLHQNYARDILLLKYGTLADGAMQFSNPAVQKQAA